MTEQRLRRPVFARLFGTAAQSVLTFFAVITLALLGLIAFAPLTGSVAQASWWLIPAVLITVVWVRALTARTSFDGEGVHTRYFVSFDYPWATMHSVTLQRLAMSASERTAGPPAIVVRMKGRSEEEDRLSPVLRCGRHRREFGTALLAAARAHGVETVVGSSGWDEPPENDIANYEG